LKSYTWNTTLCDVETSDTFSKLIMNTWKFLKCGGEGWKRSDGLIMKLFNWEWSEHSL
jgi:hypothetical protein